MSGREFIYILQTVLAGGGGGGNSIGLVSYGVLQLRGLKPYHILGKAGLLKQTEISTEISQSRAPKAVRTPKTYPILGKMLIIPGTWSGPDSKIIACYR